MPKFLLKRWHGLHIVWLFILLFVLIALLGWKMDRILGGCALMLSLVLVYYTFAAEKAFRRELNNYISTLSHRVTQAGNEVLQELPIGILLYNEEKLVEWHNPFVAKMFEKASLIGEPLLELVPQLKSKKEKDPRCEIKLGNKTYQLLMRTDERLLYFQEITAQADLFKRYQEEKTVLGIVLLDNLEEATQGMDEQARNIALGKVTGEISEWAQKHKLYLRRLSSDRYLLVMDHKALQQLEQTRFEILDEVRDLTSELKLPFTLSIGVASGADSLIELGHVAQTSLDMALGRGGDQVAVKIGQRMTFYGGRSNAVEKRTRVRARVISHALRDLIKESDKVIIMGHKVPDMDAIGAAIGVLKAVQVSQKEGFIVLEDVNPSIEKLMAEILEQDKLARCFITPEQALQLTTPRTLAVVVDTHKASLVAEARLLQLTSRIVIVDHHRRGEEFINEAVLVYMEPYASSTCELVTELLQYFNDRLSMDVLEATALLAGITMDTKSFSLRTGARTFEAASFLRRNGADTALIQRLLKEDLDSFVRKAEIIKHAEIVYDHIAVAVTEPNKKHSQLLIAQVADTLLNMTDIMASFVISERQDGLIGISARSLGQINVQVVMERMGGGGHLTNAATQLEGTLHDAANHLKQVLEEIEAEEGLFE
jgi:c-di-AMP phosphodiesterase-like protein